MIRHAFATAVVLYLISAGALLRECLFLADSRQTIIDHYGTVFLIYSAVFILNLFAAAYALIRKFSLKDTGEKLAHLEKQLRGKATMSEELTERIKERK